jgi:alginate O-acetyltransferase complex protein AlgI
MVFSSLTFLYFFLPIVMILYFALPDKFRNVIILISGLLFYAWGEPVYVLIMILSTVIDYTAGRLIHYFDNNNKKRTACLLVSVIMNLGLLAVFKYSSFIITSVNGIFGWDIPDPKLPLPIGISFYTFQSMSYTIDMYMRNIKVQKNIISFTSYVTLFPQIVAGPIVRYEDVAKEIDSRTVTVSKVSSGIGIFLKGLAKKVLLANNIGLVWTSIKAMDYGKISVVTAWLGILAFTFQIYFDFSGYSDMAIGLGKMLGFNFPQNFNHPYISRSISEFWRRWHITLGSWFRSYVYIPLGGNRNGTAKTIRNLLIVWALTGLWHGASWNFILWGLYFGVLIIIERLGWGKTLEKLPPIVSTLYTFILVVFGWVLFDVSTLPKVFDYFKAMFGAGGAFFDSTAKYTLISNFIVFAVCIFASTDLYSKTVEKLKSKNKKLIEYTAPAIQLAVLLICTAYLVDATYNPFLYFRF